MDSSLLSVDDRHLPHFSQTVEDYEFLSLVECGLLDAFDDRRKGLGLIALQLKLN